MKRCGQCENCKKLEQVKSIVLRACNPPFSHADDDVVNLWNEELERLPCIAEILDDYLDVIKQDPVILDGK